MESLSKMEMLPLPLRKAGFRFYGSSVDIRKGQLTFDFHNRNMARIPFDQTRLKTESGPFFVRERAIC